MNIKPLNCIDFYKSDHRRQYPEGTEYVYSNFTPRSSFNGEEYIIWFGLQYFTKSFLMEAWNKDFFNQPKDKVVREYKRRMDNSLGKDSIDTKHIEDLHDLGYLPIKIKALPEGSLVPLKIPVLTIVNTLPQFFWLTNYLETVMSNMLWKMSTSASTAFQYKILLTRYADETCDNRDFVPYQAHDFSFRGMSSIEDAAMSGAGHLISFYGTDTIPAIDLLEEYYNANSDKEIIGVSVPATEHSVMCMAEQEGEFDQFKRLITEVYPKGIISIVSDTWNLWRVLDEYLPQLKNIIENREGKIVIRPDSGDPFKISLATCFDIYYNFPGEINNKGFNKINNNLGVIYGDGITLERCGSILNGLKNNKFSSDNMVFGIGSYTYQYKTRDNYGFAMKATWGQVKGESRILSKDPVTDNGGKKSAKGLLQVAKKEGRFYLVENVSKEEEEKGELKTVFEDGVLKYETSLSEIRNRVNDELELCL